MVAISGRIDGTTVPPSGVTPTFTFRVKTRDGNGNGNGNGNLKLRRLDATTLGATPPGLALPCSAVPATSCNAPTEPGASTLKIQKRRDSRRDRVDWVWQHGTARSPRDFGELGRRHGVTFCLYDESATPQLLLQSGIRGGGKCRHGKKERECWRSSGKPAGEKAFRYDNREAAPGGIAKLVLAGKGKKNVAITLKTSGDRVTLPSLPLGTPLRAQLQSTNGACWEATYAGDIRSNGVDRFKAKSD